MVNNKLYVTLDGPRVAKEGIPLDDFISALQGVKDAVRLMVGHLGGHEQRRGKLPKWVLEQSSLRLRATRSESYVAELTLEPPRHKQRNRDGLGEQALIALHNWNGTDDSILPSLVVDKLVEIPASLPTNTRIWLGDRHANRKVEIRRRPRLQALPLASKATKAFDSLRARALLRGWLKEVNWDKRTAALHRHMNSKVSLLFDKSLDEEMRQSANRFVTVEGYGQLDRREQWKSIKVERIQETRSHSEPFDFDAFLKDPNPKTFDPAKVITASEPFDVDEFIRVIHEGRDVGGKEPVD